MASPCTINLDESLLVRHYPTPVTVTQDLPPHSSPMLLLDDADGHDQYSLSMAHRSHQITECIERIGRVCWGTNHVQFIKWEEGEEDEEEVNITEENLNMEKDRKSVV